MEEYSDLKFDGDLSFLNENLAEARSAHNDKKQDPIKNVDNSIPNNAKANLEKELTTNNVPQTSGKKSQLEEMFLNSGYNPELFNNLKKELLELEKEKIIMQYKQDLMMMIIKS